MRPGLVVLLALCGCYGTGSLMTVTTPPAPPVTAPDVLRAAMEEVDLTPQPGPPMYGFSSLGSAQSQGYWLRIHGRILVLQTGANHVAMVQLDLGAASTLLQRRIVEKLADLPLDPPRLVMSTTHTHGGPGAFFGDKFLNEWVAGKPAFDAHLVEYFATRIADGIRRAYRNLRPAQLRIGEARVPIIAASNRSRPAWLRNFHDGRAVPPLEEEVNRVMRDAFAGRIPVGACCIAERRTIETLENGAPETRFMRFADRVRMVVRDGEGKSLCGGIDQGVARPKGGVQAWVAGPCRGERLRAVAVSFGDGAVFLGDR